MNAYLDLLKSFDPAILLPLDAANGLTDLSGNGRNGTAAGGVTAGGFTPGPLTVGDTGATDFDGTDDRITTTYGTRRNLIPNPSFETNTTGWGSSGAGATISRVTSEFQDGTASMEIVNTGAGARGAQTDAITVSASTQYAVSMYIKAPAASLVNLVVTPFLADGVTTSGSATTTNHTGTGAWVLVTAAITTGASAVRLRVATRTQAATAVTWYADSVLLEQAAVAGTYFPTTAQLASGEAGWLGTAHASASDIGCFANGTTRTFMGWAYKDTSAATMTLIGANPATTWVRLPNGTLNINFRPDSTAGGVTAAAAIPALNQWFHWAVTFDEATDAIKIYVNGAEVLSTTSATQYPATVGALQIGLNSASYFDGKQAWVSVHNRALTAAEILLAYNVGLNLYPTPPRPRSPNLRVVTKNPAGDGYDITQMIDGLSWSSVNPGGDEAATFTFKQPWSRDNLEIARGSLIRIEDGLERLFTGRIEEHDRGGDQTEEVAVTAYGLGIRLKENTMVEVYCDRDLNAWGDPDRDRRIAQMAFFDSVFGPAIEKDSSLPAVTITLPGGSVNPCAEAWYKAPSGVNIGSVYYDLTSLSGSGQTGTLVIGAVIEVADVLTGTDSSASGTATASTQSGDAFWQIYQSATIGSAARSMTIRSLTVFGDHGLTKRGTAPDQGFYDSDIVSDVIGRVSGVTVRNIDPGSFVIPQAAYKEALNHESVITDVSRYESRDWGTWGDDSLFSNPDDGRFDYKLKDTSARQWLIRRADCASLDLHSEMSTFFDTIVVNYQDEAGTSQTLTRTRTSDELVAAGASPKTFVLDAGTQTPAAAQTLGDVFLALAGAFAPARGSVRIDGPIRHADRGDLPAYFMRADGSNIQIPDILPSTTMLALDDTPDRRTTFPIKRVANDASGNVISTTVELDQTNDTLSQLQNRLAITAERVLG